MLFVSNFIFSCLNILIQNKARGEEGDIGETLIYLSVSINFIIMLLGISLKLRNRELMIIDFLDLYMGFIVALLIFKTISEVVYYIWRKRKEKNH